MVLHLYHLSDPEVEHPEVREGTLEGLRTFGLLLLLLDLLLSGGLGLVEGLGEEDLQVDLAVDGEGFLQADAHGQFRGNGGDARLLYGAGDAHVLPYLLAGAGEVGPRHDRQRLDEAEVLVEHPAALGLVLLDEFPGGAGVEVLVGEVGEGHNALYSLLEIALGKVSVVLIEGLGDCFGYSLVLPGIGGDGSEVLVGEAERPVVEVAQRGDELGVDLLLHVRPREVGVVGVGHDHGDVVAQLVGVELLQDGGDVPGDLGLRGVRSALPALRQLPSAEHEVLVGGDVVGEVHAALHPHEDGRPDDAVERDVVLPDEIVRLHVGVLPPVLPEVGLAVDPSVVHGG